MLRKRKHEEVESLRVLEGTSLVPMETAFWSWNINMATPNGTLNLNKQSYCVNSTPNCPCVWQFEWITTLKPNSTSSYVHYVRLNSLNRSDLTVLDVANRRIQVAGCITLKPLERAPLSEFKSFTISQNDVLRSNTIDTADIQNVNSGLVKNGYIQMTCQLLLKYDDPIFRFKGEAIRTTTLTTLSADMKTALFVPDLADVSIKTSSKTFPAHKLMLTARSPVFAAMFRSNMQEASQNIIEILESNDDAIAVMLEYMYTGKASRTMEGGSTFGEDIILELLHLADKYQLEELKKLTEYKLASLLTNENVVNFWTLANLYTASNLTNAAILFILRNKDKFVQLPGFKDSVMTKPELLWVLVKKM